MLAVGKQFVVQQCLIELLIIFISNGQQTVHLCFQIFLFRDRGVQHLFQQNYRLGRVILLCVKLGQR